MLTAILGLSASAALPPSRFVATKDSVSDTTTALTWQRTAHGKSLTWEGAKDYCRGLKIDGGGWRLPTKKELDGLLDKSYGTPAIDGIAFPKTAPDFFWSSTPYEAGPGYVWIVDFGSGKSTTFAFSGRSLVRCVR